MGILILISNYRFYFWCEDQRLLTWLQASKFRWLRSEGKLVLGGFSFFDWEELRYIITKSGGIFDTIIILDLNSNISYGYLINDTFIEEPKNVASLSSMHRKINQVMVTSGRERRSFRIECEIVKRVAMKKRFGMSFIWALGYNVMNSMSITINTE